MGTGDLWRMSPSSGKPRESQAKFRAGTVRGLKKGHVGTGSVGSAFGENSFYLETRESDEGVAMWLNVDLTPGSLPRS